MLVWSEHKKNKKQTACSGGKLQKDAATNNYGVSSLPCTVDGYKDIVVEIERTTCKKPFLGGYRHKKTNVEYHHASAQTMQKPRPPPATERFCRDTQTTEQRHFVQQTTNDTSTQMTKIGVYVSNMEDKMLVPGHYTTADEYKNDLLNRVGSSSL